MEFLKRHKGKLVASFIITVSIWLLLRKGGLKIVPEGGDFGQVKWWIVPVYFAIMFVCFAWFRAVRWRFLLRGVAEVPKKKLFAVSNVGFFAILLMPFRLGEFVRPYMIRTRPDELRPGQRPITMTAATSTIVAERVIDGLYISLVLAAALLAVPLVNSPHDRIVGLPVTVEYVRTAGFLMLALFSILFVTIAVFYFARSWAHRTTLLVVGKVSMRLAEKLAGMAEKFADGLHVFGRGRDAFGFFAETTVYWGLNALGIWLLAWGCGVAHADGSAVTFGEACALMGILGCAIIVPGPPGLLGVFQGGLYAGMAMYFPTNVITGPGAAFAFVMYASQLVFQLMMAGVGLAMDRDGLKTLEQAELAADAGAGAGAEA